MAPIVIFLMQSSGCITPQLSILAQSNDSNLDDLGKQPSLLVVGTLVIFPPALCVATSPFSQKYSLGSSHMYQAAFPLPNALLFLAWRIPTLPLQSSANATLSLRSLCRFLQRALQLLFCAAIAVCHADASLTGRTKFKKGNPAQCNKRCLCTFCTLGITVLLPPCK